LIILDPGLIRPGKDIFPFIAIFTIKKGFDLKITKRRNKDEGIVKKS
jgi:hypothetical protein